LIYYFKPDSVRGKSAIQLRPMSTFAPTARYILSLSSVKCSYCKLLWIKSSAISPRRAFSKRFNPKRNVARQMSCK
jgi:hypothetical protein